MTAEDEARTLDMVRTLLDRAHLATPGQLPDAVLAAARVLGWTTSLHLADFEQRQLVSVPATDQPAGATLGIDATLAGRCFRTVHPLTSSSGPPQVWLPVVDGTERLGVLGLAVPEDTDTDDPQFHERCRLLGHLTGHLIAAKRPYGDGLDQIMRRESRSVAAELLHGALPPRTFACDGLVVSGFLQPTYSVAADAFDYSVVDDTAHLAIFDVTGHDLEASALAAVTLAAYRNSRQGGGSLHARARVLDEVVSAIGTDWRYASGVLAELDLDTGMLRYINAGHPPPLLMRHGKVVKELTGGHRILFGLGDGAGDIAAEWLEPGDWIVFYTDGITEARDNEGVFFGVHRLVDHLERAATTQEPAPETLRQISHAVLDHQQGQLQDDATLLLAEWATGQEFGLTSTWTWTHSPATDDPPSRDLPNEDLTPGHDVPRR